MKRKQFDKHFEIMMHPTTYINKLVFAVDNKMELWNIIEDELVYTFTNVVKDSCSIKSIVQSPVIHTVSIGFSDGEIMIANL